VSYQKEIRKLLYREPYRLNQEDTCHPGAEQYFSPSSIRE